MLYLPLDTRTIFSDTLRRCGITHLSYEAITALHEHYFEQESLEEFEVENIKAWNEYPSRKAYRKEHGLCKKETIDGEIIEFEGGLLIQTV